jgi:hypothetical protein
MNKPRRTGPVALMLVPCEDILIHPSRESVYSLINILDRIETNTLPFALPRVCVFTRFSLYDGGEFTYKIEVWDQAKKTQESAENVGKLSDPSMHFNGIVTMHNFTVSGEGQMWVKVLVNGEESLRVPIFIKKIERGAPGQQLQKERSADPRLPRERASLRDRKIDKLPGMATKGDDFLIH